MFTFGACSTGRTCTGWTPHNWSGRRVPQRQMAGNPYRTKSTCKGVVAVALRGLRVTDGRESARACGLWVDTRGAKTPSARCSANGVGHRLGQSREVRRGRRQRVGCRPYLLERVAPARGWGGTPMAAATRVDEHDNADAGQRRRKIAPQTRSVSVTALPPESGLVLCVRQKRRRLPDGYIWCYLDRRPRHPWSCAVAEAMAALSLNRNGQSDLEGRVTRSSHACHVLSTNPGAGEAAGLQRDTSPGEDVGSKIVEGLPPPVTAWHPSREPTRARAPGSRKGLVDTGQLRPQVGIADLGEARRRPGESYGCRCFLGRR